MPASHDGDGYGDDDGDGDDGDDDNECCPTRRAIQETEIWRPIFLHTHRE